MFDTSIALLDWLGVTVFAFTGALVAARNKMDVVGFILLGTITGIGGGTLRDVLLNIHPILWIEQPAYIFVCVGVSILTFFTAHTAQSHQRLILWLDAVGLALFATTGAERALSADANPVVAIIMGMISACFGGIIRDTMSHERSIIFSQEIYVTATFVAAVIFVSADSLGVNRELAISAAFLAGFITRGGALLFGWSLPRYRQRPGE